MKSNQYRNYLLIILFILFHSPKIFGNSEFQDIVDSGEYLYAYSIEINEAIYGISNKRVSIDMVFFINNPEIIYPKSISSKLYISLKNTNEYKDIIIEPNWLDSLRLISIIHNSQILNICGPNNNQSVYDLFYSEHALSIEEFKKNEESKYVGFIIGASIPAQGLYSNLSLILDRYNVNISKIFNTPLFKEFEFDEDGRIKLFIEKNKVKRNRRY